MMKSQKTEKTFRVGDLLKLANGSVERFDGFAPDGQVLLVDPENGDCWGCFPSVLKGAKVVG